MDCIKPNVSIIIPTYNRNAYIVDAIKSVLNQTYQDFEVIVVDDGSTDNTRNLIESISDKVKYIFQDKSGRSNARNHGLKLAQGKYIAFLDSDDLYLPDKLRIQVEYMNSHPQYGMLFTSAYCVAENGEYLPERYEANISGNLYKYIAFYVPVTITLPTVMVRREVFDKVGYFDESMERFEDTDMWRRISKYYQIAGIKEYTCKLRTHSENCLVNQNPTRLINSLEIYYNKVKSEDKDVSYFLRSKGMANLYSHYGKAIINIPEWRGYGYILLLIAIRIWPFNIRRIINFVIYHSISCIKIIINK